MKLSGSLFLKSIAATVLMATGTIILAGSASAGTLNFDFRYDLDSTMYNDAAKAANGVYDNYKWYAKVGRLDYQSRLNDDVIFKLRANFANKNYGSYNLRDSFSDVVDLAYVQHQIGSMYFLTAGKFASEVGGWENSVSTSDQYFFSRTRQSTLATDIYYTGAKFTFKTEDHEFALHAANNTTDAAIAGKLNQNRGYTGFVYKGAFLDKMLKPAFSYHTVSPQNSVVDPKVNYTYMTLGLRYDMAPFVVDLDVDNSQLKGRNIVDQTDTVLSTVLAFNFSFTENWTGRAKFDSTTETVYQTTTTTAKTTYTTFGLAGEYKPTKDNFRYHIAYTTQSVKPETGDTRQEDHMIAGIRILADFLK